METLQLGIKKTHGMNLTFMAKMGCRLISGKQCLWTKLVSKKYVRGEVDITKLKKKPIFSNIWRGVVLATYILKKGLRKRIYNGADTLFWRYS